MTPTEKFRRCDAVTAAWEGGYVNHPKDPGGATDRGITQATYDGWRKAKGLKPKPVRGITAAEAATIFFEEFWTRARCETLAVGVDLATYDAAVNSGVSRGRKWLMASIGGSDVATVKGICSRRLGFMQSLNIWKTFGKGWGRRVADIQAKGVAWSLAAVSPGTVVAEQLEVEAAKKETAARRQETGAAAGGTAGTGTVVVDQAGQQAADWLLTGIGVLVIAAAGFLIVRAILNRQQAEAFAREARAA